MSPSSSTSPRRWSIRPMLGRRSLNMAARTRPKANWRALTRTPRRRRRCGHGTKSGNIPMNRRPRWDWTRCGLPPRFGALMDALKMKGVYDDTLVILQNDHGQVAKGLLYEQGTRILNFQRYPPLFGKDGMKTLPDDFVTSNVDLASTIFELAGVSLPSGYQMDGVSYLDDVVGAINEPSFDQVADGEASCEYKYLA